MGRTKKIYTFDDINSEAERFANSAKQKISLYKESHLASLHETIDLKDVQIAELNHQIVGYKAVISYLEHQLGLGKSQ
jgi:hypothetical protein